MMQRTVDEADLARYKQDRETADTAYNQALTALDQAVQSPPEMPAPPRLPDELQITPLNERWNILTAARPLPAGWRGRLARFVLGLVEPMLTQQQAFNSALVDHINRNAPIAREVTPAVESTMAIVRQQAELTARFQSRLMLFAQQVTPFVDSKDYEFHAITRRINEDALEAADRVRHRLSELIDNDIPFLIGHIERMARGTAAGLSGVSDEMLKRFESTMTRVQRTESTMTELTAAVNAVQQLAQGLRRDLHRREAGRPASDAAVPAPAMAAAHVGAAAAGEGAQQMLASDPVHSHQYVGFEDLYRGTEVEIQGRMTDYAELFRGASDVLDIGCGRGEFLALLRQLGISARGIDLNHEMVIRCQAEGLDVTEADALGYLTGVADDSLGGIIATQVVEHLPPDYLMRFLTAAFDKLRPGATLVLETINPASWAAFFDSYIRDLTHMRPVHPDTLRYLVTASGFADARICWRSPYPESSKLQPLEDDLRTQLEATPALRKLSERFDENVRLLNSRLFTFMDYAVIARRPAAVPA